MTSRPSTAAPILAVLAVVLVTLGIYVGGYFSLGQRADWPSGDTWRVYPHAWQAHAFGPLARCESLVRSCSVICIDEDFASH